MGHTTIVLLLAAATFAQGKIMPWHQGSALKSVVKQIANSNGRRLSALMTSECQSACPKVMDFLTEMSKAGDSDQMTLMCANIDSLTCIAKESVCQDDGTKGLEEAAGQMGCVCACPEVATADIDMEGQSLTAEECEIVKCVLGEDACAILMSDVDADAQKSMDSCDAPPATSDHPAAQAGPFALLVLSVTSLLA